MKTRTNPITPYEERNKSVNLELADNELYQSLVGGLNSLGNAVRFDTPDIVNWLARKTNKANSSHLKLAKKVLVYLRDTNNISLKVNKLSLKMKVVITTYVDASFANIENRRSICGYVIFINDNSFMFKTTR